MKTIMNVYCMYDKTAEEAWPLFESVNDGTAMRAYNIQMQKDRLDYEEIKLFRVAEMDRESMRFMVLAEPEMLEPSLSMVEQLEEENA